LNTRYRLFKSNFILALCGLAVLIALVPLAMILFYVLSQGATALNWAFFTQIPRPVGEAGGGMGNAILGTLILIGIAASIAVPVGVITGIHLAEYGGTRFASFVRFGADVLNGVPSIVVGIFAYGLVVLPVHQFSALAGGFALSIMMVPIVARTTEELLRLVPNGLKEGALALGTTRWEMVRGVVFPYARGGIAAALILGLGRAVGEAIAVTQVIGGGVAIHWNLFSTGDTLASKIASSYQGAATNLETHSLIYLALILLVFSLIANLSAQWIVRRVARRQGTGLNRGGAG